MNTDARQGIAALATVLLVLVLVWACANWASVQTWWHGVVHHSTTTTCEYQSPNVYTGHPNGAYSCTVTK